MMSDKLDWTKNLGDAVLAQQSDVMDAIQRLRAKAQANNKLTTTKQQKVSVQHTSGKKDGLYWPSSDGEKSPLGELAAQASAEGYKVGAGRLPYHGYYSGF